MIYDNIAVANALIEDKLDIVFCSYYENDKLDDFLLMLPFRSDKEYDFTKIDWKGVYLILLDDLCDLNI